MLECEENKPVLPKAIGSADARAEGRKAIKSAGGPRVSQAIESAVRVWDGRKAIKSAGAPWAGARMGSLLKSRGFFVAVSV